MNSLNKNKGISLTWNNINVTLPNGQTIKKDGQLKKQIIKNSNSFLVIFCK